MDWHRVRVQIDRPAVRREAHRRRRPVCRPARQGLVFCSTKRAKSKRCSDPSPVTVYVLFGLPMKPGLPMNYFGVWRLLEEYRRRVGPLSDWWWRLARVFGFLFFMAYVLGVIHLHNQHAVPFIWTAPAERGLGAEAGGSVGLAPDLFEPSFAAAAIPIELVPKRVLQVIVLVIVFSRVERARSRDLRHDRIREPS